VNYKITSPTKAIDATIVLRGSKSISNRLLIMQFLSGDKCSFINLSNSKDTNELQSALAQISKGEKEIYAGSGGTTYRFLTAMLALQKGDWVLNCSNQMKARTISELVDALKKLGAEIEYAAGIGYPPLIIKGGSLVSRNLKMEGDKSSQFISALLMIAPYLNDGLTIETSEKLVSKSYINLTLGLMKQMGAEAQAQENSFRVSQRKYAFPNEVLVEADWSSAAYFFEMVALANNATIKLKGLSNKSLQADSIAVEYFNKLGVNTAFENNEWVLTSSNREEDDLVFDCKNCPDLVLALVTTCVGLNKEATFLNIAHLAYKESNRIEALQMEIAKFGWKLDVKEKDFYLIKESDTVAETLEINTHNDHRMAMAFAPLTLKFSNLIINNTEVVHKSYPGFWGDLEGLGFGLENTGFKSYFKGYFKDTSFSIWEFFSVLEEWVELSGKKNLTEEKMKQLQKLERKVLLHMLVFMAFILILGTILGICTIIFQ